MKLPDKPEFFTSKVRGSFLREPPQIEFGEVYVTCRSAIKHAEDVQQGTLSGTGLADDGKHFAGAHLERQILKEHEL